MRVIYTRLLFWASGMAVNQNLVLIAKASQNDFPLLVHEQKHVEQMKDGGALSFWWRYITRRSFRMYAEVQAYRAQIAAGGSVWSAAQNLSARYWLGIDHEQAMQLLTDSVTAHVADV